MVSRSKAFLVNLMAQHRELLPNKEAFFDRSCAGGAQLGLRLVNDVQVSLNISHFFFVLAPHTDYLRINLHLHLGLCLALCFLDTIHLVMHVEKGDKWDDIREDKVGTLKQLKKARVVRSKLHELHYVNARGQVKRSPQQVRRAKESHDNLEALLLVLHRRAAFQEHNCVLLAEIIHNAHQEEDACVKEHRINAEKDTLLDAQHAHAQETVH